MYLNLRESQGSQVSTLLLTGGSGKTIELDSCSNTYAKSVNLGH